MNDLAAFLDSDAGLALKGLLIVSFLDFATGTFAALRDGTFALDAIAAFVRKHILGRVAPIGLLLTVGYFGGAAGQLFLAGAVASAAAYVAETVASVWGNVVPPKASAEKTETEAAAVALNPVPDA
jgi:hypothetical protein